MKEAQELKIKQITQWLKDNIRPSKLYLYGSRASSSATANSDYDFVALVPDFNGNRINEQFAIQETLRKLLDVEVQVWIYSQDEFNFRITDFNSIPETAVNTGREIEL